MSERLELSEKHRKMVETLLDEHVPGIEVWAYGSRVNGRSHAGSDLDLVLRTTKSRPMSEAKMRAVENAFKDSNLPFLVDVHDWSDLPDRFHSEIERNHVILIAGARQFPNLRRVSP